MCCGAALAGVAHLPEVYTWFSHSLEWWSPNQRGCGVLGSRQKIFASLHYSQADMRACFESLVGLQLLNVYLIFWRPSSNKSDGVWRGRWGWGGGDKQFTCFFNYASFVIRSKLHIKALARSRCQTKQLSLPFQTSVQQGQGNLCLRFLGVDFKANSQLLCVALFDL